jgi:hypothetical protein
MFISAVIEKLSMMGCAAGGWKLEEPSYSKALYLS